MHDRRGDHMRDYMYGQAGQAGYPIQAGARFSKVPIINGPGKLSPFTLNIEVSIVLHLA